jgi:hypothetical protein
MQFEEIFSLILRHQCMKEWPIRLVKRKFYKISDLRNFHWAILLRPLIHRSMLLLNIFFTQKTTFVISLGVI